MVATKALLLFGVYSPAVSSPVALNWKGGKGSLPSIFVCGQLLSNGDEALLTSFPPCTLRVIYLVEF